MPSEYGKKLAKHPFIQINAVLFVFGVFFLVIVALMKSEVSTIKDETKTVLNSVKSGDFGLGDLADRLSTLFVVVGNFIIIASGLGLFIKVAHDLKLDCIPKQTYVLLMVYAVFISVIFVMNIVAISIWFKMKNDIDADLREQLVISLHTNFVSDSVSGGNEISNGWNMIFISLDCCAVNNVASTTNDFDNTPWCTTSGECQATNAEIPKACCVGVSQTSYTSAPITCYYNMNPGTYNTKGCYQAISDSLKQNITSDALTYCILAVGIILLLVEVISLISAVFYICSPNKIDTEDQMTSKPNTNSTK